MGGTLAATSHVAKASTRAAVNTSPEPFSNIGLSLLGDAAVPTMLWLAWEHPLWFFAALALAVALMLALTVLLLKFARRLLTRWRGGAPVAAANGANARTKWTGSANGAPPGVPRASSRQSRRSPKIPSAVWIRQSRCCRGPSQRSLPRAVR